ncbi:hypothetical protein BUALT_Bualt02G0245900 [Buddleja alternifolia]|uniref:Uncharacterized protein n=1 Tax=Buddleja alternifolia TaxID=168488 RepID=A0AAV6Y788_9LAMI|nr:hypothetical protein BUALT_Bualt02G0245900 [Buddleja alternifolia]
MNYKYNKRKVMRHVWIKKAMYKSYKVLLVSTHPLLDYADAKCNALNHVGVIEGKDHMISGILRSNKMEALALSNNSEIRILLLGLDAKISLPKQLGSRKIYASDFDGTGCIKNGGAKAFNAKLNAHCEEFRQEMKNFTIVYVDMYTIKYDFIANPTSYGFAYPLMLCCGNGGPPYNYDPNKACWGNESYDLCEVGTPYISWDGVHYTEAANSIVASKILSTNYSIPPLKFDFFLNNV